MKISKHWVTALLLAPGIYLVSCGPGSDDNERSDTLSTQSAPPSDVQSSTSDQNNMGDSSTIGGRTGTSSGTGSVGNTTTEGTSGTTGSTGTGGSTGTTGTLGTTGTGETTSESGVKSRSRTTESTGVTRSTRRTGTTGTRGRTTTRTRSAADRTRTERNRIERRTTGDREVNRLERKTDTAATRMRRLGDTTAERTRDFGDTAARKLRKWGDTTMDRMDRFGDTARRRMDRLGDTISNRMDRLGDRDTDTTMNRRGDEATEFDSTRGNQGNISGMRGRDKKGSFSDTTDPENRDASGSFSTQGRGTAFTPQRFITSQIESNYAEIKMARMAIDRTRNNDIKRLARTIENDHNTAVRELQSLARNSNMSQDSLPTMESDSGRHHMDMLQNAGGEEFDKQWVQHMHMMHEQKIQLFEQLQRNDQINDPGVKNWVTRILPTLRKHRDELNRHLNRTSR